MRKSTGKTPTMIRTTADAATQLSRLALELFNSNVQAYHAVGLHKSSTKVAVDYCISLAEPELKRLGIKITADNNLWRQIMAANRELDAKGELQ